MGRPLDEVELHGCRDGRHKYVIKFVSHRERILRAIPQRFRQSAANQHGRPAQGIAVSWNKYCQEKFHVVSELSSNFFTDRPKDVDRAILRRMPSTFHIGLPDTTQRKSILRQILQLETIADDIDYNRLAQLSEHFSGSDIRELCRTASVYRVRDLKDSDSLRPINMDDLLKELFSLAVSGFRVFTVSPMVKILDRSFWQH